MAANKHTARFEVSSSDYNNLLNESSGMVAILKLSVSSKIFYFPCIITKDGLAVRFDDVDYVFSYSNNSLSITIAALNLVYATLYVLESTL